MVIFKMRFIWPFCQSICWLHRLWRNTRQQCRSLHLVR